MSPLRATDIDGACSCLHRACALPMCYALPAGSSVSYRHARVCIEPALCRCATRCCWRQLSELQALSCRRCEPPTCRGTGLDAGRSGIASTDSDGSSRCCLTRRHQDGPRRTPCVLSGALAGAVERTVYPDAMQWLWTWRRPIGYRQHVLRRQLSELQALSCRRCDTDMPWHWP